MSMHVPREYDVRRSEQRDAAHMHVTRDGEYGVARYRHCARRLDIVRCRLSSLGESKILLTCLELGSSRLCMHKSLRDRVAPSERGLVEQKALVQSVRASRPPSHRATRQNLYQKHAYACDNTTAYQATHGHASGLCCAISVGCRFTAAKHMEQSSICFAAASASRHERRRQYSCCISMRASCMRC